MIIPEANRLSTVQEYYFSRKLREIREMSQNGSPVINLGIGSPDLPPSEGTITALCDSAVNPGHHGYQSYKCIPGLREAMASWYRKTYEVQLDPESEILPLIGSKEGIMHVSSAFINPGDSVLVPNPGYPTYTSVSRLLGADIQYYDLDEQRGWAVDMALLKKRDLSKVKIMWLNYPNMPTGARGSNEMFQELIQLAREHRFLICNDNPYSMILNDQPTSVLQYEGAKDVVLELNSLSKSHNMAGWRMGWLSGHRGYIDAVLKVKSNIDSGIFLPLQHAAIAALENTSEWHSQQNSEYKKRRLLVWELMDMLGTTFDEHQSGMFVWAKVAEGVEDVASYVDSLLYGARVFITPGFIFGSNGERYVRISLCSTETQIMEATNRIKQFLLEKAIS